MATASPARRRATPDRYTAFLTGEITVEDLDMEELLKGQLRDKNGTFQGRPPKVIPRDFHVKVTQELLTRAEGKWREHMEEAMQVFVDIMTDPKKPAQFRLQAAQYVFERIAGKIPDKQIVEASVRRWEDVAEAVLVEVVDDTIEDAIVVEPEAEPTLTVRWDDDPAAGESVPRAIEPPAPRKSPRRPTRRSKGE